MCVCVGVAEQQRTISSLSSSSSLLAYKVDRGITVLVCRSTKVCSFYGRDSGRFSCLEKREKAKERKEVAKQRKGCSNLSTFGVGVMPHHCSARSGAVQHIDCTVLEAGL